MQSQKTIIKSCSNCSQTGWDICNVCEDLELWVKSRRKEYSGMVITKDEVDIITRIMELHDGEFCLTTKERVVYKKLNTMAEELHSKE